MRKHLSVLILFTLLTGAVAFPVVDIMARGGVPGWEGDNVYYVHSMWWWKHSLFELHTSPFFDPESFYPQGRENGRSEMTVTNTIPAIPVTWLFSPTTAYDVSILASFVMTGFFTYLWVLELTGRRDAAILGGTVAAFLPMRFAHMPGHLPQMTTQWVALSLYGFERYLRARTIRRALLFGIAVACTALGCWYYGYALAIVFPVYAIARTWRSPVWRERRWWIGLVTAGALAVVVMGPFVYEMLRLRAEAQLAKSLVEMDSWSLNPYDLFLPNLAHPVWGDAAARWFPHQRAVWVEKGVTLGYTAVALAVWGWIALRRRERALAALAATWAVSYCIALGPTLHWGNAPVQVHGVAIPLPAMFMYNFVPLTSSMRVMARFALWTGMMTAALAAFGCVAVVAWAERRWGAAARGAVPVLLVALVVFESLPKIAVMPLGPRAVDTWLAQQPSNVVIVELPVQQAQRSLQNYWMTINRKKNLFGWVGDTYPPPVQVERVEALKGFPAPSSLDYLRRSAATHLLVTPSQVPGWTTMEPILRQTPALADEQQIGDVRVYRIVH